MTAAGSRGLTLAVTSSTGVMGLAVGLVEPAGLAGEPVQPLAEIEVVTDRRHAEEISPRLRELLTRAGVTLAELDRLAIDIGPGRFTGLRVGLATVRALGYALNLPVVGLTSLAVLAAGVEAEQVTAVIDARRQQVFQQSFSGGIAVGPARVGDPEVLAADAVGVVVGDGLDRYLDRYLDRPRSASGPAVIPVTGRNPRAVVMLESSRGLAGKPGTEIEPLYLREPDANPNIKTRPGATTAVDGAVSA